MWSPVPKRFTSAKADPCGQGDELPPVLMPKMPKEELNTKEHEGFDRDFEICDYYIKNFRFDGNEVSIRRIACCLLEDDNFGDKELVTAYLKSPIRNVTENA